MFICGSVHKRSLVSMDEAGFNFFSVPDVRRLEKVENELMDALTHIDSMEVGR